MKSQKCYSCPRPSQMPASEFCDFCGQEAPQVQAHGNLRLCPAHVAEAIELESTPWPGPCPEMTPVITLLQEKLELGLHELCENDDE